MTPPDASEEPLEVQPAAAASGRLGILRPLRIRDFALLWTGATVSLVGDGIYLVAIAWQVLQLSNTPTALSLVGLAWTLSHASWLLVGGVVGDRFERRKVMIAADVGRGAATGALAVLAITGALRLWHVLVLVAIYGMAEAFFAPAFGAIVPQVVPDELLVHANALDQVVRRLSLRFAGPAVGGSVVAALGSGGAFALDAASFGVSALALSLMRPRPVTGTGRSRSGVRDVVEVIRFVRGRRWLWATLVASTIGGLAVWGPIEVLVPYLVKNDLGGDSRSLGLVLAGGGLGSVAAALALAHLGVPGGRMRFLYAVWASAGAVVVGYGLATNVWHAAVISFANGVLVTAGVVVWTTVLQTRIPRDLLGRVMSLDGMVAIGLVPLSFALTAPAAALMGADGTLIAGGAVAAFPFLACLLALRAPERVDDSR